MSQQLRVGDIVRCFQVYDEGRDGEWDSDWAEEMDGCVGLYFVIEEILPEDGYVQSVFVRGLRSGDAGFGTLSTTDFFDSYVFPVTSFQLATSKGVRDMKFSDLPEEIRFCCENFPSSPGTRVLLTSFTGHFCPEVKTITGIKRWIKNQKIPYRPISAEKKKAPSSPTPVAADGTIEPTAVVKATISIDEVGKCDYAVTRYANRDFHVPISIIRQGAAPVKTYIKSIAHNLSLEFEYRRYDYDNFRDGDDTETRVNLDNFAAAFAAANQPTA